MENELLAAAQEACEQKDWATASTLLKVHLRRHPDDEEGWLWLSRIVEPPQERIACCQQALAINPQNRLALVDVLLASRKPEPPKLWRLPWRIHVPRVRPVPITHVIVLLAAALLFLVVGAATLPMFLGDRTLAIVSGSMEPAIQTGAAVVAQPVPSQNLQVGDVIVFSANPQGDLPLVHRIASIREQDGVRFYTTRGDANSSSDQAEISLPPTAWRVWYHIPLAGYLIAFASSRTGVLLFVLVPLVGLVLSSAWEWLKKKRPAGALWSQS